MPNPSPLCSDVRTLIEWAARRYAVNDRMMVAVAHWFGIKWLGFQGKRAGAIAVRTAPTADANTLVIPPFHANRIAEVELLTGTIDRDDAHRLLTWKRHEDSKPRNLSELSDSLLVAWWSRDAADTRRGSVLMYVQHDRRAGGLYIGVQGHDDGWKVVERAGIGTCSALDTTFSQGRRLSECTGPAA